MIPVERQLAGYLAAAIQAVLGEPWTGEIPVEVSNRPDLGDYASGVAFHLARIAKQSPLAIAEQIASELSDEAGEMPATVTAQAPGFINFRLHDSFLYGVVELAAGEKGRIADSDAGSGTKVVIEHTNINPNKAAHVGHFRNACLGDSLARAFRRLSYDVEVQNYIDDTGAQVADVVVGLRYLDLPATSDTPFDQYLSQVYVEVQRQYDSDPDLKERRTEVQRAIEAGEGELVRYAHDVTSRVAARNLETMARAGVFYDLLTWESDILALGFWGHAFQRLKEAGAIRKEGSGPNAGCWVLPFGGGGDAAETASDDKVLVTSRGIATYTAKDIAYQLWKFGLLGLDFRYRRWGEQGDGSTLWSSTRDETDAGAPAFAHADVVVNVIDATQAYPQQVVYESLRRLGYAEAADRSEHLAYERVSLAADAARELGAEVSDDASVVAMTGRGGIQVFADDLLDRLAERVSTRAQSAEASEQIAAGAARYYMLKYSNNQRIAFDFDEALRTTGETGVYLQYAYVRSGGIVRKLAGSATSSPPPGTGIPDPDRNLVLAMARYPTVLSTAVADRSVQTVAKYAFDLATAFNAFYDNTTPVVREPEPDLKAWRTGMVGAFRLVMGDVLDVLGIAKLEQI